MLKGKIAIVTGAGRGIGREIALTLAKEGVNVSVVDIDLASARATAGEIEKAGANSVALQTDVTNSAQVKSMVEEVMEKFRRVDILINNAGITRDRLLVRMSDEDWNQVLAVNLTGAFNCLREVSRIMIKQRSGKIVNIASIIGMIGNPGQANYAASKGGLIALTKSAARELASRGITVNAIAPGFIKTQMTEVLSEERKQSLFKQIPLARFGEPEDIAQTVLFLVSDNASYITGQVIRVDGGLVM